MTTREPITEADLHAYVDGQLPLGRQREIEAYLADRPAEAQRVATYRAQKSELHALFDPVLDEVAPQRIVAAARPPTPWYRQPLVAGLVIALISGAAGWEMRGALRAPEDRGTIAQQTPSPLKLAVSSGFVQRAAVAHAVYSPDQRRPVEIDAAHEEQLVAWLSKRMAAPMKPPALQGLGYVLEGGRLLPGGEKPVAQFMYRNEAGDKLTLYVSNEFAAAAGSAGPGDAGKSADSGFRFAQQGKINVFYWVDGPFGYAISAAADRSVLERVSSEVYRQLGG